MTNEIPNMAEIIPIKDFLDEQSQSTERGDKYCQLCTAMRARLLGMDEKYHGVQISRGQGEALKQEINETEYGTETIILS